MTRRDFLRLRLERGARIVELSCERLFMRAVDSRVPAALTEPDDRPGGEPPRAVAPRPIEQLIDEVERETADADVLRIAGAGWLASDRLLEEQVNALIASFEARGGLVEYV